MNAQLTRYSKFISLVLRHQPEAHGLTLDPHDWVAIDDVLAAAQRAGLPMTREDLAQVVAQNDKQRFALSEDGTAIRARQGHSVAVDLEFTPVTPPAQLYHGTATRFLPSIRQQGLLRQSRQHVHLSPDAQTALKVGQRHGQPAVLYVASGTMHHDGYSFFLSENGVWLVDAVPVRYLTFPTP